MTTIYKYTFDIDDKIALDLPMGAEILDVQYQKDMPTVWALVSTEETRIQKQHLYCYGTGHSLDDGTLLFRRYFKTIQSPSGLVWHLYL